MITRGELDNRQEEGSPRSRRKPAAGTQPAPAPSDESTAQEPQAEDLERRIQSARALMPRGADLHCAQCWTRGRDAAIRVFEGPA